MATAVGKAYEGFLISEPVVGRGMVIFRDPNGHRIELAHDIQTPEMKRRLDDVKRPMLEEWAKTRKAPKHAAWLAGAIASATNQHLLLADARGKVVEAQDFMRRYLADPVIDANAPGRVDAERVLSQPRPPSGG